MKFRYGIDIYSWENEKVGELKHVVIDPGTDEITHLVAEKGFLMPEDKLIPVSLVMEATDERIKLFAFKGSFEDFDDFIEIEYVRSEKIRPDMIAKDEDDEDEFVPLIAYPPAGAGGMGYTPMIYYPEEHKRESIKNIPAGTQDISEGTEVVGLEGERVGNIEEMIVEPQSDQVTHFVISKGILFTEDKLIPSNWVKRYDDDQVKLLVDSNIVEQLPEYER
ncbi:MAG: PRC-barrel domain-containing protein [Anaerolineales bacterium]|jgi:uncharacterized protein YrrD